jgi:hypothetical protein
MIYLKNTIKKYWRIPKDDEYKLPLGKKKKRNGVEIML